jgi:serine/threonine-protein kinase
MAKLLGQTAGVQTASGAVMGTPLYMAPEQALGKKIDGRADVYALGILTHELLTGKRPITGETAMGVLAAHLTVPPPPMSEVHSVLDARLDAPVLRMLEKNPDARPATAGAAIADLKRAAELAGHVIPAETPHLLRPERAPRSREGAPIATTDRAGWSTSAAQFSSGGGRLEREGDARTGDPQPSRRGVSLPVLALLVVVGAGVTFAVTRVGDEKKAAMGVVPSTNAPAAGVSAAPIDPVRATEDSAPAKPFVDLMLQGAPPGARVLLDGKPIGEAPGPVPLPTGDAPIQLTVTAPGYETGRVAVIPNQAASAAVMMRRRAPGPASSREGIPRDLENPF